MRDFFSPLRKPLPATLTAGVLLPLLACTLVLPFITGCYVAAPHGHHHGHHHHQPPRVNFGHCQAVDPYCLANPGRYAEPMHPVIGTNGAPYLLPQSGLKSIIVPPAQPLEPPATLPE